MATKIIDFIQSEQIVKLEEDVNILKDKLNLLVADINQLAPKLATIISNLNAVASAISNNYDPTDLTRHRTWRNNSPFHNGAISTDGVLKRLTDFDTYYTEHISKKFPPVSDIQGAVHVGYHTEHNTTSPALEHAHPEGWQGQPGTCLTATVTANTATGTYNTANVAFIPYSATTPTLPTNTTWEGLRQWDSYPTAEITMVNGVVVSSDFRLDALGGSHANSSYGYGWSVGDQMMSMSGSFNTGNNPAYTGSEYHAVVTSVGSQLEALPYDNSPGGTTPGSGYRTPHGYVAGVYGLPAPGVGGPPEPAPPAASLGSSETSTHNIMDPSNQLDDQEYITTVLNTGVVPSYLNQAEILFMSDEDKIKRAKKLVRMTKNRLRDDSLWETEDVSDGVLTADDFVT
jgi:hypothetical protein